MEKINAFQLYTHSQVFVKIYTKSYQEIFTGNLIGAYIEDTIPVVQVAVKEGLSYFRLDDAKLILRKMAGLSDDEKVCIYDLIDSNNRSREAKIEAVQYVLGGTKYFNGKSNLSGRDWCKVINYLRSIGVDMDDLIEAGIAIDASTM